MILARATAVRADINSHCERTCAYFKQLRTMMNTEKSTCTLHKKAISYRGLTTKAANNKEHNKTLTQ